MQSFSENSINDTLDSLMPLNVSFSDTIDYASYSVIAIKSVLAILMFIISFSAILGNLMVIICTINDKTLRTVCNLENINFTKFNFIS